MALADQPLADQPLADQPLADQPLAGQPLADQPLADQPLADQPLAPDVVVDPSARLLDGGSAGETWDVSASFTGGFRFFVRFWVTNEGPGSHTAIAMGYFVRPDGRIAQFRYGRTRNHWRSGAAGRFLKVASAVLDLRAPSGAVEIDTNRGGMKIYLRFDIPPVLPPLCARRGADAGFDVLRLQQHVEGIAWVAGMAAPIAANGSIDITHTWGAASEIDTVLRRIDAAGRKGDLAFFATASVPPNDRGHATSCVAVVDGGKRIYESQTTTVEVAATPLDGTAGGYPVPSHIAFHTDDLELTVRPSRELLRVNPLDTVPQPFRLLLGLRSSPRRAWTEASWQLDLRTGKNHKVRKRDDHGLAAVGYTNEP